MVHSQILSRREKVLALIAGTLVVVFAGVGYAQSPATTAGTPVVENNQAADQNRVISEKTKQYENWMKDFNKYTTKYTAIDSSRLRTLLDSYNGLIAKWKQYVATQDFNSGWDTNRDLDSMWTDINDAFQIFKDEDEWKNVLNNCKNQTREITKDMANNVKNWKKDLSKLKSLSPEEQQKVTDILAKIDAKYSAVTTAQTTVDSYCVRKEGRPNDYYNDNRDVDDAKRDFYDLGTEVNEVSNALNCKDQLARDLKNKDKNIEREYNRVVKQAKGAPIPEDLESAYRGYVGAFDQATQLLAAGQCEDARSALQEAWNTHNQAFWEAMRTTQEGQQKQQEVKNVMRQLVDQERELKRIKNDIKRTRKLVERVVKKYLSTTDRKEISQQLTDLLAQAEGLITQREEIIAKAKAEAPNDPDTFLLGWDEFNDFQQEFNDLGNKVRTMAEVVRELQQNEKEIKRRDRELKRFAKEPELLKTLQDLVAQAKGSIQNAWALVVGDPEAARGELQGFYELSQDWDEAVRDWQDSNEDRFDEQEFSKPMPSMPSPTAVPAPAF